MSDHPSLAELDAAMPFVDRHIGLRPEDIVVALNGSPIESVEELQRLLSADTIDAPQSVTVLRAGTVMQLEVRPTELAA